LPKHVPADVSGEKGLGPKPLGGGGGDTREFSRGAFPRPRFGQTVRGFVRPDVTKGTTFATFGYSPAYGVRFWKRGGDTEKKPDCSECGAASGGNPG